MREYISNGERFEILQRDKFKCQYCGSGQSEKPLQVDHIIPVSLGGRTNWSNLTTACFECNSGKRAKLLLLTEHPICDKPSLWFDWLVAKALLKYKDVDMQTARDQLHELLVFCRFGEVNQMIDDFEDWDIIMHSSDYNEAHADAEEILRT